MVTVYYSIPVRNFSMSARPKTFWKNESIGLTKMTEIVKEYRIDNSDLHCQFYTFVSVIFFNPILSFFLALFHYFFYHEQCINPFDNAFRIYLLHKFQNSTRPENIMLTKCL